MYVAKYPIEQVLILAKPKTRSSSNFITYLTLPLTRIIVSIFDLLLLQNNFIYFINYSGQIHFKTAIQLTALADKESDIVQQFIFYLKAAMHFVVAGLFIDHPGTPCSKEAQSSYKEARKLIK